jgi:uncharacterized protein DUF6895
MLVPAAGPPPTAPPAAAARSLPDFLDRALDWVHLRLDLFRPLDQAPLLDPIAMKATAELALACASLVRAGVRDTRVTDMVAACEETARSAAFRAAIGDYPQLIHLFAPVVGGLCRCGLDDEGLDELTAVLQSTYDQGYVVAMERTPSQTMDLVAALDASRVRHGFPPMEELLARSIVGRQPPVGHLADADVYDLTHVLFAACDMGLGGRPPLPPDTLRWSTWATGALLRLYLAERDWDLVGELLLACRCLDITPEPVFSRAWQALVGAQAGDGSVPDGSFSASRASTRRGEERRLYEFGSNYHPTIVAVEAAALALDDRG